MSDYLTLEQLEQQVTQLPPQEQLKLVAHISERLSALPLGTLPAAQGVLLQAEREQEAERLLARCDEAAEMWEGDFDAAEEIRQMRRERDEQLWPRRSQPLMHR